MQRYWCLPGVTLFILFGPGCLGDGPIDSTSPPRPRVGSLNPDTLPSPDPPTRATALPTDTLPRPPFDGGLQPDCVGSLEPSARDGSVPPSLVTYTLDLTAMGGPSSAGEVPGAMCVSHNALAAFPLDFSAAVKTPATLAPEAIDEWQSKSGCAGFPTDVPYLPDSERGSLAVSSIRPDNLLKGFRSPHRGRVRRLSLEMPDRVLQGGLLQSAGPFCIVFRNGAGQWLWRAQRFEPKYDAVTQRSTAEVDLDVADVDTIAILFESTTGLASVRYTVEH